MATITGLTPDHGQVQDRRKHAYAGETSLHHEGARTRWSADPVKFVQLGLVRHVALLSLVSKIGMSIGTCDCRMNAASAPLTS